MAKYKVSYQMKTHDNKWKKDVTSITYNTKAEAQKYANQLNKGGRYRYARVRKV